MRAAAAGIFRFSVSAGIRSFPLLTTLGIDLSRSRVGSLSQVEGRASCRGRLVLGEPHTEKHSPAYFDAPCVASVFGTREEIVPDARLAVKDGVSVAVRVTRSCRWVT
jgi:hypothetical protein